MGADKVLVDRAGTTGARPYGIGGIVPDDAVVTARRPHGAEGAVRYYSDAPFVESYADRAVCSGTKKAGGACKAKARPGESYCDAHTDQG